MNHGKIGIILAGLTAGCLMTGCIITTGCSSPPIQAQRTVELAAPMAAGGIFAAESENGSIQVQGQATQCHVTATITGRGWTDTQASELVNQVQVRLEPAGNKITVVVQKPISDLANTISLSYDAKVPSPCDLELISHNGNITARSTQGAAQCQTQNGRVNLDGCTGPVRAKSQNGNVEVLGFSQDLEATSQNGKVTLVQAAQAQPGTMIKAVSQNGSIHLTTAPNLSAKVRLTTQNGSIHTSRPIAVEGKIDRSQVTGTIGTGTGELILETHNGSITLE